MKLAHDYFSVFLRAARWRRAVSNRLTLAAVSLSSSAIKACNLPWRVNNQSVAGFVTPRSQNKGNQRLGATICAWRFSIPLTIALARVSGVMGLRKKAGKAVSFIWVASWLPPKATSIIGVAVQPG